MDATTLAEVICNLNGWDPNNDIDWEAALRDAQGQIDDANSGLIDPWWVE